MKDLTRDEVIIWFQDNFPMLYGNMELSNHNLTSDKRSPFHAEGSVWTHTMMVMTYAYWNCPNNIDRNVILFSAILHDVGKPNVRELKETPEKTKVTYKGHEGVSTMLSLEVLEKAIKDNLINEEQRYLIVNIISLHGTNTEDYKNSPVLYNYLTFFRECDKMGAVRNVNEDIYSQYDSRNFSKNGVLESDETVLFVMGLPCSGKSTFIREKFSNVGEDVFILSRDTLMMGFGLRKTNQIMTYNETYDYVHNNEDLLKEFNKEFDNLLIKASNHSNVIVDMTMLSLSSRRKMMNQLGERTYNCITMLPTLNEIYNRNESRQGKYISNNVYDDMMKSFVIPVLEEGFQEIQYIF